MPLFARRSFLIGTALVPWAPALAHAQASGTQALGTQIWPARPVTLIIPFPAGGAMDLLGRSVAQDLADKLGLLTTGSADFHGPEHARFSRFRAFSLFGREPRLGTVAQ